MSIHEGSSAATNGSDRSSLRLGDGLRVEEAGEDLLVLDPTGEVAHRVTGAGVEAVRRLADGDLDGPLSPEAAAALDELVDAGIATDGRHLSRRKVMVAGGVAWTAATVTTFALANPAAASTGCPNGFVASEPQAFTTAGGYMFKTGPSGGSGNTYSLTVRAWGGGGGGGGSDSTGGAVTGGGGGGGGAYASASVSVTECTSYKVVVGSGGSGGSGGDNADYGGDGLDSVFGAGLVRAAGGAGGGYGYDGPGSGGSGGLDTSSVGVVVYYGGSGGNGGGSGEPLGGGSGGGSAGDGGTGSFGNEGTDTDVAGGAGGVGVPGGAAGGTGAYNGTGGGGFGPGGGGGGGSGNGNTAGGAGADGAVWVGL